MHRTANPAALARPRSDAASWWQDATVYRVYLPSFADGNGDGTGDLIGLRERLGYLSLVGVDAMSLSGLLTGPSGAEVPTIDRAVGGLPDLDALLADAHDHGLKVLLEPPADSLDVGLERTLRFWLDRGVDGFRTAVSTESGRLRRLLDSYPGRVLAAPTGTESVGAQRRLERGLAQAQWDAAALTDAVTGSLQGRGGSVAWLLADRELPRPATRYGGDELGRRRARAAALLHLALPGGVEVCAGDELGLPDVPVETPPVDAALVPMPWAGEKPPYDFTRHDTAWLPMPEGWADLTVESQLEDAASTLSLYRQALEIRHTEKAASGDSIEWYGAPTGCLAFRRTGGLVCAVNTTDAPVPLPPGNPVLSSVDLVDGELPGDAAAWLL